MGSTPSLLQPPPPRSGRVVTQHCPRRRLHHRSGVFDATLVIYGLPRWKATNDHCLWNDADDDEEEDILLAPTNFDNYMNKQQIRQRRRTMCALFSQYAGSAKSRQTNIYTDNTYPITSSNSCSRSSQFLQYRHDLLRDDVASIMARMMSREAMKKKDVASSSSSLVLSSRTVAPTTTEERRRW